jgi:hypothetical protein
VAKEEQMVCRWKTCMLMRLQTTFCTVVTQTRLGQARSRSWLNLQLAPQQNLSSTNLHCHFLPSHIKNYPQMD